MLTMEHADSQIIERLLAASRLTARPMHLVTDDGNVKFNAKIASLKVLGVPADGFKGSP